MEPASGGCQLPSSPPVCAAVSFETLCLLWDAGVPGPFQDSVETPSGSQLELGRHSLIRGLHRLDCGAHAER